MSRIEPVCRDCDGLGYTSSCVGMFEGDAGPFFAPPCTGCEGRGWTVDRPWLAPVATDELELPFDVGC